MLWFTSDWHVNHNKIIELDQRPFADLDQMHRALVKNFNAAVKPTDTTYFLGDMGFGDPAVLRSVVAQLNGKKILIRGNHDRGPEAMLAAGFDVVQEMAMVQLGKTHITLSHFPLAGVWREDVAGMRPCHGVAADVVENWHGEQRHMPRCWPDRGQVHLHGHVHKGPEERILGRQWDAGVRANNYRPVSLSMVASAVALGKLK